MNKEEFLLILTIGMFIVFNFFAILLDIMIINNLLPSVAVIISGLSIYLSKRKKEIEVHVLKEHVNALFFPGQRANTGYYDGSLRIDSLFFYNEGDYMAILDQNFSKCNRFDPVKITLLPENSSSVAFGDFRFENTQVGQIKFPSKITIRLIFVYNRKDQSIPKSEDIPVNCEVRY